MKKIYILTSAVLLWNLSIAQNIPNGNFETWGLYNTWNYTPENWNTGNFQLFEHVFIDSAAYEGNFAMKVFPYTYFEAAPGYASTSLEIDIIPQYLSFYVKCDIPVELDSVSVSVSFFNGEYMVYSEKWSSDESIEDWQQVVLELDQIEPIIEFVIIDVVAGYGLFLEGSTETWISIDAIEFSDEVNFCRQNVFQCKTISEPS